MPRAVKPMWSAERRLDWIDDRFAQNMNVHRDDVSAYFGVAPSIGSGDMMRYIELGGAIKAVSKGYERLPEWQSIRRSTPQRVAAWKCWAPLGGNK